MPTKATTPHEILIRFDEKGAYRGAHYDEMTSVLDDDGTVLAATVTQHPIKAGRIAASTIRDLIDTAAAERIDVLEAEAVEAAKQLATTEAEVAAMRLDLAQAEQQITTLNRLLAPPAEPVAPPAEPVEV